MAEAQDDTDVTEESSVKSKKMMIIIVVVILALIGGGTMMFLGGSNDDATTDENAVQVKQAAIYSEVKDPFIVNFSQQSNNAARYLQVKLKVMARDQAVIDAVELHMPVIQHEFLLLLYGQNYDDLTKNGTKTLQAATLALINNILKAENVENELKAVYFTSFLMQ